MRRNLFPCTDWTMVEISEMTDRKVIKVRCVSLDFSRTVDSVHNFVECRCSCEPATMATGPPVFYLRAPWWNVVACFFLFIILLMRCNGNTVLYFYLTFNLFKSSLSSCRFNTYHPYVLFTYTPDSSILFFFVL